MIDRRITGKFVRPQNRAGAIASQGLKKTLLVLMLIFFIVQIRGIHAQQNPSGNTRLTLTSSGTSIFGSPVTFTCGIAPIECLAGGSTCEIDDGSSYLGTTSGASTKGGALFTTSGLTVGTHTITAQYAANSICKAASTSITQVVTSGTTPSISISSSQNPSTYGQAVNLTATVTSSDTNTISFYSGSALLGTAMPSSGTATLTTSSLPVGSSSITARIAAGGNYTTATSSAITQTVNQATPTISINNIPSGASYGSSFTTAFSYSGDASPMESILSSTTRSGLINV